jgi:hypothetical protein
MGLSKIPIFQKDLNPLVRSIGYYFDGCLLTQKNTNRKAPFFLSHTCRLFKGCFECPDYTSEHHYNQFYFDDSQSTLVHGRGCIGRSVLIPKTYSDIVPHSRELISHLNASFYRVDEHALVSQRNIKQLLFPRSNLSEISQSAFSRILINMRAIFLKQNANNYCHLPSFLRRFHSLNPQSTVALQVDDHDCFFRMFVAIPRAAAIFRAICLPMLFIDGVFYKMPLYDRVLILVVAKSGNGSS